MKKRWIPFIVIAAMLGIGSIATADETEMDFYISEDDSEEILIAADDAEEFFEEDGLVEDLEAAQSESILIDDEHFPDGYFRSFITAHFDLPDAEGYKDGVLSAAEIAAATELVLDNYPINLDLTGIRYLKSLKIISCTQTPILNLNAAGCSSVEEIYAKDCRLESIDLTGCTSLKTLDVMNSCLSSLDLSSCSNLTYLNCSDCELIKSLDVSCCPKLTYLGCCGAKLTSLDVSMCPKLSTLYCHGQYDKLISLNISNCNYLETCLFNYTYYCRNSSWDDILEEDVLYEIYMYSKGDIEYELYYNSTAKIITSRGTFPAYSTPASIKKALVPKVTQKTTEKITITKKPTIKKPAAKKNKITVKWKHFKHTSKSAKKIWKKIKKVQIQCATDKAFKNIVKTTTVGKSKTKGTIKGLKKKTTYYVRVRYYDGTGYSAWSKVKKIKTKK